MDTSNPALGELTAALYEQLLSFEDKAVLLGAEKAGARAIVVSIGISIAVRAAKQLGMPLSAIEKVLQSTWTKDS
jgi:hypothetical protein